MIRSKETVRKRVNQIMSIANEMAKRVDAKNDSYEVQNRIEEIQLNFEGYAEPGYETPSCGIIALGNWNNVDHYVPGFPHGRREEVSNLPKRIGDMFEKLGVEVEWNDEWSACYDCGKLFRVEADCYSWQKSFIETSDGHICHECVKEDVESYLESLEGKNNKCNTISSIDPGDYGYVKFNKETYETGYHEGQTDDPKVVALEMKKKGITRFLFNIDCVQQFDVRWSVWIYPEEKEELSHIECEDENWEEYYAAVDDLKDKDNHE